MESFSNLGVMFPLIKTYEERDADERKMLFAADSFGSPSDSLKLSQYMENYWQHFHPSFPMIHKNNFLSEPLAPLLHAAMLSIGAQFSPDADAKAKSRSMHELCVKVLSMVCSRSILDKKSFKTDHNQEGTRLYAAEPNLRYASHSAC